MNHKTKPKQKFKFWQLCILLIICLSIMLSITGMPQLDSLAYAYTTVNNNPDYDYYKPSSSSGGDIKTTLPHIADSDASITSRLPYQIDHAPLLVSSMPNITKEPITSGNQYIQSKYPEGQLNAYSDLTVVNHTKDTSYGGWKYASFVDYFKVVRTDGRAIYDDDGILDVSWWKNGNFGYSNEIIDYQSEIWVKTNLMPYNYNGFLGTILNTKFKSGAYFEITWDRGEDPEDSLYSDIHDKNANTMGSGNYRNGGVNPGDEYYKLCDWDYCSSPYITIVLKGTGYWENGWWGGSYDYTDIYSFMSGFMPRSDRNWSNTLTADYDYVSQYGSVFFSPSAYIVTSSNLNNYTKVNGLKQIPIESSNCLPYADGLKMAIINEGVTTVEIEDGAEGMFHLTTRMQMQPATSQKAQLQLIQQHLLNHN